MNAGTEIEGRALLLVGSAKPEGASTSESLGGYLLERLAAQGWRVETLLLHRALRTAARIDHLRSAVDAADLVILAFPLYVDALPYLATRALEEIAGETSGPNPHSYAEKGRHSPSPHMEGGRADRSFLAIVNCGFPEAEHCDVALAICRQFADAAGFAWAGGLALGGGGVISGRPLAQAGGMARNVIAALDQAAEALAQGEPVPPEAIALMRQPMMRRGLYLLAGNAGWLLTARKNEALRRVRARPLR